jgi:hypothetical protein
VVRDTFAYGEEGLRTALIVAITRYTASNLPKRRFKANVVTMDWMSTITDALVVIVLTEHNLVWVTGD